MSYPAIIICRSTSITSIEFVLVDIVDGGLLLAVRTVDGVVGIADISLVDSGTGYAIIQIENASVDVEPAPARFMEIINRELPGLIASSLDTLLEYTAGPDYDFRSINFTETTLRISLSTP